MFKIRPGGDRQPTGSSFFLSVTSSGHIPDVGVELISLKKDLGEQFTAVSCF